ncbi:PD-(D/E)XK nuclease family protein [Pseudoscardovia radai]|uniref:PD-(D/E)XK nuclease family protein n=1 Tax=Pseudoscardovia radai TaxID=987066 RepID=UPI0039966F0C
MTNTPTQSGPTRPQGAQSQGARSQGAEFQGAGEAAALVAVDSLYAGTLPGADGTATRTLYVSGAPRSGKTAFALHALLAAYDAAGTGALAEAGGMAGPVMLSSSRLAAQGLNRYAIGRVQVGNNPRIVTTISALAFSMLTAGYVSRLHADAKPPRLLNGAEQDALLDDVLHIHLKHAHDGELCSTCMLLKRYFEASDENDERDSSQVRRSETDAESASTTEDLFSRSFVPAFTSQLRDFLARANEVGADAAHENAIFDRLDSLGLEYDMRARLSLQWKLAFALRREYVRRVSERYPDEYRVDASFLLSAAAQEVENNARGCAEAIPSVIVMDDAQDITLAGMRFLQAMERRAGTRLIFVGNADEAVQVFRGSYPDFLYLRMVSAEDSHSEDRDVDGFLPDGFARLNAATSSLVPMSISSGGSPVALDESNATYRDVVVSRVSLGIATDEDGMPALPDRPGKMPRLEKSLTGRSLPEASASEDAAEEASEAFFDPETSGIAGLLFRSAADEMNAVIRRISRMHLDSDMSGNGVEWNDIAIIAHDNSTVRAYGERMQELGIPVRYTSVTHSFAGDPVVEGLLALVDLARMRSGTYDYVIDPTSDESETYQRARQVRRAMRVFLESPYADVDTGRRLGGTPVRRPLRVNEVLSTMSSIQVLAQAAASHPDAASDSVKPLLEAWSSAASKEMLHDVDGLCMLLVCGEPGADKPFAAAEGILSMMESITASPDIARFRSLFDCLGPVCDALDEADATVDTVLWAAWNVCQVSDEWSKLALLGAVESHRANDSLDTVMRLFRFAHDGDFHGFAEFAAQVRTMDVEADSLAKTGPVVDAVTLTTPAGAAGRSWPFVWIPAVQQGVWPNSTVRNTMFGGEDLTDIMLRGNIRSLDTGNGMLHDSRVSSVLHSEEKSFLVALTRGERLVTVSCAWDADHIPSVFLTGFMRELFPVSDDPAKARFQTPRTVETKSSNPAEVISEARCVLTRTAISLLAEDADVMAGDPVLFDALAAVDSPDCPPAFRHAASLYSTLGLKDLKSYGGSASYKNALRNIIANDPDVLRRVEAHPEAVDAIRTLRYLAAEGYDSADPRHWPFVYADGDTNALIGSPEERAVLDSDGEARDVDAGVWTVTDDVKARRAAKISGTSIRLNPSSVDALWHCPICALLDKSMSGPDVPTPTAAFGSIVHKVAQTATENGWDDPTTVFPEVPAEDQSQERENAIARRLRGVYDHLSADAAADASVTDRYALKWCESKIDDILAHVAHYFVDENRTELKEGVRCPTYGVDDGDDNAHIARIGLFASVEAERQFSADFTLDDIVNTYNAAQGKPTELSRSEMLSLLDLMCGGFPDGFDPDTRIHLSARVDRLEKRIDADGEFYRIIDFKTGQPHSAEDIINDLQLVCYQLAMHFSPDFHGNPPDIAGADLFYVRDKSAPGEGYEIPELYMQPALFDGAAINLRPVASRDRHADTLLSRGDAGMRTRLRGMSDDFQRKIDRLLSGSATTVWALTMISRVFYAASVMQAEKIPVRPPRPGHGLRFCDYKRLCPACAHAGRYPMDTVMGRNEER